MLESFSASGCQVNMDIEVPTITPRNMIERNTEQIAEVRVEEDPDTDKSNKWMVRSFSRGNFAE